MFESPCVSMALKSFFMIKQHKRHTNSNHSHSFYVSRAPRILASSVVAKEARVDGTMSLSPTCLPVVIKNTIATHTEPSPKLTTAHGAHHRDGHVAVSGTREPWNFAASFLTATPKRPPPAHVPVHGIQP